MGNQNKPRDESWLRRTLNDILTRLRALETAPRTRHAGVSGGTLRITNGGKIIVGDASGYTIVIDPDQDGTRPRITYDLGDSGVAALGVNDYEGSPWMELRITAPDGAVGVAGVAADRAGFWLYPDGLDSRYQSSVQVGDANAVVRFNDRASGDRYNVVQANASGVDMSAYDDAGGSVAYLWVRQDGTIRYKGTMEQAV